MSYDTHETSVADGRPYFLYEFSDTSGSTFLTSDPETIVTSSHIWTPESITHDNIFVTGNVEKNDLQLRFPLSSGFAQSLLLPSGSIMSLTVFRGHHSDLTGEIRPVWKGRIVGAKSTQNQIVVTSENIYTSLRRTGCTARVQRTCRHALYLPGCNVNKDLFGIQATITALSGLTLTVPGAVTSPATNFKAGMLDFQGNWGFINYHSGSTLKVISEVVDLEDYMDVNGSAEITLYPGCDRSEEVCNSVFNNILNHGGFKRRPKKNPFSGSII